VTAPARILYFNNAFDVRDIQQKKDTGK